MATLYDAKSLDSELKAVGLPILGCNSKGAITWESTPSASDLSKAQAVMDAHDATKEPLKADASKARLEELIEKRRAKQDLTASEQQEVLDYLMGV